MRSQQLRGVRFDNDVYQYGAMRDYKHRETLRHAQWPDNGDRIGDKLVLIVCLIVLFSFIVGFIGW
jgi:hypothetical protein